MATDSNIVNVIAERYALAVYELADEGRILDNIAQDLTKLQSLLDESEDLKILISSPLIDTDKKKLAIEKIMQKAEANSLTQRFIAVIAQNNRLFILPATIEAFLAELAGRRGEIIAEVTSAKELNESQMDSVTNVLRGALGNKVTVDAKIDSSLIGGLIVRVGSRMIDASLKTKLQRLQLAMKGAQ